MQTRYPFLLLSAFASVLYASEVLAVTCTATPECASLGYKYSKEDCPRGGLKCPTGDSYYCSTPRPKCNIGDIFYTDNTCVAASNHDSSKTVLGIVVYVTDGGKHGQIMAPWAVDKNGNKNNNISMEWGESGIDIINLPNNDIATWAETDFNSCSNTSIIVAAGDASAYPAAWAARKYAPTPETAGKWCLPAAGVLRNIQKNWTVIDIAVSKVGRANIGSYWCWTSSEGFYGYVWNATMNGGNLTAFTKERKFYVLPVLEF